MRLEILSKFVQSKRVVSLRNDPARMCREDMQRAFNEMPSAECQRLSNISMVHKVHVIYQHFRLVTSLLQPQMHH